MPPERRIRSTPSASNSTFSRNAFTGAAHCTCPLGKRTSSASSSSRWRRAGRLLAAPAATAGRFPCRRRSDRGGGRRQLLLEVADEPLALPAVQVGAGGVQPLQPHRRPGAADLAGGAAEGGARLLRLLEACVRARQVGQGVHLVVAGRVLGQRVLQ